MTPDKELTSQYTEMELRDEAQIIQELKGEYIDEFVYQFQAGGRTVTGISWAGIKEVAYKFGGIQVDLVELKESENAYTVIIKATDTKNSSSRLGVSTQLKKMKLKSGESVEDEFALQKVMSKAQRNAIRPLIPETTLKVYIEKFLEAKKGSPHQPFVKGSVTNVTAGKEPPKKVESVATVKQDSGFTAAAEIPKVPDDFRPCEEAAHIVDYVAENYSQTPETVRALVWREMTAAEPHLSDVEAAKAVQALYEERSQPAESSEADTVYDALQKEALDGNMIEVVSPGCLKTRKKRDSEKREFLGDRWHDYNNVLWSLGYQWVKEGENSRWERKP